jgi:hypothetical protein
MLPLEKVIGLDVRDETVEDSLIVPACDESQDGARHSVRAEPGRQANLTFSTGEGIELFLLDSPEKY